MRGFLSVHFCLLGFHSVHFCLRGFLSVHVGTSIYVNDDGFTKEDLAGNKHGEKLLGRNLNDRALQVVGNYKYALKFYQDYAHTTQEEVNPSGKKTDDMLLYVRQKMFVKLRGGKDGKAMSRAKRAGKTVLEDDMPDKYTFTGFFAFVLFGPHGLSELKLSCLSVDGKGVPQQGRRSAREEDGEQKKAAKAAAGAPSKRDVSVHEKATAAHLAQRDLIDQRQNIRELLFVEATCYTNLFEELKQVEFAIKELKSVPPEEQCEREMEQLKHWKQSVYDGFQDYRDRKRKLDKASDELMHNTTSDHVNSFLQVEEAKTPARKVGKVARQLDLVAEVTTPSSTTDHPDDSSDEDDDTSSPDLTEV